MADIKVKKIYKKTIKKIDKSAVMLGKLKNTTQKTKEVISNNINKEENKNPTESSSKKIEELVSYNTNKIINKVDKIGKKSIINTRKNIKDVSIKVKELKAKKLNSKIEKSIKNNIEPIKKIKSSSGNINKLGQAGKESFKLKYKINNIIKNTTKATIQNGKAIIKISIKMIKIVIESTKALITALIVGGWISVIFIILICLIGLFSSSIFGIFLSSEKMDNNVTMNEVVRNINNEFANEISTIQKENIYDDYVISSNRAGWKEILAIYAVKISNGEYSSEVITLNDYKINVLKDIFWNMNIITSEVKNEIVKEESTDENGNTIFKDVEKRILHIDINKKSMDDMRLFYNFNNKENKELSELLKDEYSNLWNSVIFGSSAGSSNMVSIALTQVGNTGGLIYWKWYGFNSRVEWCAIFVSYIAEQAGYISAGIIPKFASCDTQGVTWFKAVGQWKDKGFIPKAGDIIFFDWEQDGKADHVGIVEKVENNVVYTIEGNSNDECRINNYGVNSKDILGYGTPMY